jgi:hypothetical protein
MFHNSCVGNLYYKLFCIGAGIWNVKSQLVSRNFLLIRTESHVTSHPRITPQNYTHTWTNGAESHFRGTGTMFRPNYCTTLTANCSLKKHNLVRNWIVFLFIIMAEHLSVESLTLLLLNWNYVNISVDLGGRRIIKKKTTFFSCSSPIYLKYFIFHSLSCYNRQ